jgi:acyl-CoA synthetase (AMP-forming)/AMP-acid ligase II
LAGLIRRRSHDLGDQPYLEHARSDRCLSYRQLDDGVTQWSAMVREMGLAPGAAVAIDITDPLAFSCAFLGVIASGRWAAPLDPKLSHEGDGGLVAVVARVRADHVVADRPAPHGWSATPWTVGSDGGAGTGCHSGLIDDRAVGGKGGDGGGVLLATSGTTGVPKLIALAQSQLLHAAGNVSDHHRLASSDRGFNPLPLFHINAEVVGLLATLVSGSCLVLDDRFHRTGFWALMDLRRITWINAVPVIISRLAALSDDEVVPAGIRFIRSASSPLPTPTLDRFEEATGIRVLETYGMTEAASQITANPLHGLRKPGSVGVPVGVELRIVPDVDSTRRSGQSSTAVVGHVEIRGPSVITAYGGDAHGDRFDDDGWLRTGDIGHLDDDGFLYLSGRSDDVINRGGEKIFPREIEDAILGDPDVVAVSVVGRHDPVYGQVPVAFLVLRGVRDDSHAAVAGPIVDRIRHTLESKFVPSRRPHALHVVSQLPIGATGKVQRRLLRDQDPPGLYHLACR